MANYKRSGGNGFGLKLFAAITSLLLAASVITTGVCFGTGAWQLAPKDDPAVEQPDDQTPDETPDDEGGMIVDEGEANGISVMSARIAPEEYEDYGISPMAESAQQLTATITPSNATNQKVDWTVKWKNASSSWANGKTVTDYVTVTPTSDGALTANVECKQAFGEQVKITCTSRDNENAKAECNVDYAKKVTFASVELNTMRGNYSAQFDQAKSAMAITFDFSTNTTYGSFEVTPFYSAYTVDDTFDITSTRTLATELWNNQVGGVKNQTLSFNYTDSKQYDSIYFLQDYGSTEVTSALGQNLALAELENLNGAAHETVTFTFTGEHSTYTFPVELRFRPGTYVIRTETVQGLEDLLF